MCDHEPVEQIRGKMAKGDYFDAIANSMDEPKLARLSEDYHLEVDLNDDNRTDFRIICGKCFLSTGWMKADAPGMPGALMHVGREKWKEMSKFSVEEWNAEQRKSAVRSKLVNL